MSWSLRIGSHLTQQIGQDELEFEEGFSPDPADIGKVELEFEDWFSPDPADRKG